MRRLTGSLALVLLLTACGSSRPAGGDPGGKRLHELSSDPIFSSVPPGATNVDVQKTPAQHRKGGFTGDGWAGPAVVVTFTSSASPEEVFRFYDGQASQSGWQPKASGSLGVTDRWAKTFSDGAPATLFLARLPQERYRLSGGIAPINS